LPDADFLRNILSEYGIVAVFAGTFLEGESVLVVAGAMASQQFLNPLSVWIAAAAGAWSGHIAWFIVGRFIGKKPVERFALKRGLFQKLNLVNSYIEKNRTKAVVLLQYLYGVRIIGAISFGISEIKLLWFAAAQAVNCIVWAILIGSAGFFFGKATSTFSNSPVYTIWISLSILILLFIARKVLHLLRDK